MQKGLFFLFEFFKIVVQFYFLCGYFIGRLT
nr:MAG TPA: hypothetical protein [Bacteriophage sp.]